MICAFGRLMKTSSPAASAARASRMSAARCVPASARMSSGAPPEVASRIISVGLEEPAEQQRAAAGSREVAVVAAQIVERRGDCGQQRSGAPAPSSLLLAAQKTDEQESRRSVSTRTEMPKPSVNTSAEQRLRAGYPAP